MIINLILKIIKMNFMSKETLRRALKRALEAMIVGAMTAFVAVPVNLEEPKKYFTVLAVGMMTGILMGLKKAISGYIKYDR